MALAWGAHEVPPRIGRIRASGNRAWEGAGSIREWLRMELVEVASEVRKHGAALREDGRSQEWVRPMEHHVGARMALARAALEGPSAEPGNRAAAEVA